MSALRKLACTMGLATMTMAVAMGGATAAEAAPTATPQVAVTQAGMEGWEFFDDYWNLGECEDMGKKGKHHNTWRDYSCAEDWVDWNLYVLY